MLFTRPALVKLWIFASGCWIGLAHFDQHGRLNTFTKDKRAARGERGQLIKKLVVDTRNNFPEVAQILRILEPMDDEAVALREHRL